LAPRHFHAATSVADFFAINTAMVPLYLPTGDFAHASSLLATRFRPVLTVSVWAGPREPAYA
jgi:hypothetical protein